MDWNGHCDLFLAQVPDLNQIIQWASNQNVVSEQDCGNFVIVGIKLLGGSPSFQVEQVDVAEHAGYSIIVAVYQACVAGTWGRQEVQLQIFRLDGVIVIFDEAI